MADGRQNAGAQRGTYDELPDEKKPTLLGSNRSYVLEGEIHLIYDGRLWRRTGQTQNPRVIALNDAVGWHGDLLTVHTEGAMILLQHKHAGIQHRIYAGDRTRWSFVTFEEVETW